jgi:hypothetical protein
MNRILKHHFLLFVSLFFISLLTKLTAEDSQAWITAIIPITDFKTVKFSFWQQYRLGLPQTKLVDSRYSILAVRPLYDWLDSEVHVTLIYSRKLEETPFKQTRRLELELNPHFHLKKNVEVKFRNRYELIHREDTPHQYQKFRQQQKLVQKLDRGSLRSASIHNEIFYNMTENRVDEYRLVPLELDFAWGEKYTYNLYTMIRWRKPTHFWKTQLIWGLTLGF